MSLHRSQRLIAATDCAIEAYLVQSSELTDQSGKAAIIVIHEVFGVNDWLKSVCDRLAEESYVVIAPNMVQRTAPGLALGYSEAELALGRSHKDQMTVAQIESDFRSVIAELQTLGVDRIGMMGFCFGGHVAFLGAMQPEVKATAIFYGSGIGLLTPGGGEASMTRSAEIHGRVDLYYGTQDSIIPNEQADAVEAALTQAGVQHRVFRYPAEHGFFCEVRSSFQPEAAADSWLRVKELFQDALLSRGPERTTLESR